MKRSTLIMIMVLLAVLAVVVLGGDVFSAGNASLGMISVEAPRGWDISAEEKRIIGKPASGSTSSREWYALGSELFVILGPEPDPGRDLSAVLKKFMEDTFVGYAEIDLKSVNLKLPSGIENLGFSGSMRNRNSGDIIYAIALVLRHKGSNFFFIYDIDREESYKKFSAGPLLFIMNSIKVVDGSGKSGVK
ncbi:MAG TPA: hypothetical protein PLM53_12325 [Spirochaetota bacterium]|nr:hypothetical protein [Spirochaetota bacterium]HPC42804.1 hypothetical protein [Spirochaetota bacterium]HPL15960.1 hypothetical protein [Spirochaetota bacterium]HQF08993.1 hypothetical protein [Spirochaetota bacterium]HQH97881.1 hypothetical protein [Spirochaetota bacterium]